LDYSTLNSGNLSRISVTST